MPKPTRPPGYELPFLLLGVFRRLIDDLHQRLADEGHPELRPAHAVTMRTIGPEGSGLSEMAGQLSISRQAVAKTVDRLVRLGYVTRDVDPSDARAKIIRISPLGIDALQRSARILDDLVDEYEADLGHGRMTMLFGVLGEMRGETQPFAHLSGWYGEI